jgi:hypothetical protein
MAESRTRVRVPLRFPDGYETNAQVVTFIGLTDGKEHLLSAADAHYLHAKVGRTRHTLDLVAPAA